MKNRKKNRLLGYDYRQYGYYFVTICSNNRIKWFGNIENNHMVLNLSGQIVRQQLQWLEKRYSYIKLDEYIIMPNHIHGIIIIKNYVGNGRDRSLQQIKSLSSIIGAFKTTSSKLIHRNKLLEFKWQKSFHDHIIRNDKSLHQIREYIINNPLNWNNDENNIIPKYSKDGISKKPLPTIKNRLF